MAPVAVTCSARERPRRRGRKKELHASRQMPKREKGKLMGAWVVATRIVAGRVRVMPKPVAGPFMAAMVGLVLLWIARESSPPLCFCTC